MSIGLNIYGKRRLTREELAEAMATVELPEELRWELRFVRDWDALQFDSGGAMQSQIVVGWHPQAKSAGEVRKAIERKDAAALKRLFREEAYGLAHLSVTDPADDDWAALTDPEFLESVPAEHREAVKQATTWYEIETFASRNETSWELQEQLWRMIGVLTDGVMEDPQEGEFEAAAEA